MLTENTQASPSGVSFGGRGSASMNDGSCANGQRAVASADGVALPSSARARTTTQQSRRPELLPDR